MKPFCGVFIRGFLLGMSVLFVHVSRAEEPRLTIAPKQQISIVGNTLAERMQHDGWLETTLQARYPEKQLRIRNLGFSADALDQQLRVTGFGSQDEWLQRTQADIIFAFFGFNWSFLHPLGYGFAFMA